MTIRPATLHDAGIAAEWWRARNRTEMPVAALPAIGVICEDIRGPCGAVWAYLNAKLEGHEAAPGVAFVEYLVMRPGLALGEATRVGAALMGGIESAVKSLGYGLLVAYSLAGCARYLRSLGWESTDARPKIAMHKILDLCPLPLPPL